MVGVVDGPGIVGYALQEIARKVVQKFPICPLDKLWLLCYTKVTMGKVIKISDKVAKELDKLRHVGQSYDGVLTELLEKQSKSVKNSDKGK